jgi:ribosomal protein S18 acetylase RimI-like enzyme
MPMRVERLTNKAVIRAFLVTQRARYAYMLGDLADPYWPNAVFYGSFCENTLCALVLKYTPISPHPVISAGDAAGVSNIMRILAEDECLPVLVYHAQSEHMAAIQRYFATPDATLMWRMAITPAQLTTTRPLPMNGPRRLSGKHAGAVQTLLTSGSPSDFMTGQPPLISPGLLDSGVFYGVLEGDRLWAVAGTHIISSGEQIGAVGYVFTDPQSRGKGFAQGCTAAVTRDLFERGLTLVALNVKQDNAPAVRAYERIGYIRVAPLWEGTGRRTETDDTA